MNNRILVTGCLGFIGFHTVNKLSQENKNFKIFGIDNINSYYDVKLKKSRLNVLKKLKNFSFTKLDIRKKKSLFNYFKHNKINFVVHLAAQAGVRHSISNPEDYIDNNIIGFFNILESSRKNNVNHLVFASTSSVYGDNKKFPLKETYNTDKPLSFYAATKKSNEVMAYSYSYIYKLPCTALRFFTVYGPYGRPDMSLFKFTDGIINEKRIELYNYGDHVRDFTYIDDIVDGILSLIKKPEKKLIPFEVYNIGSGNPKSLKLFLSRIEKTLAKKAKVSLKKMQQGDIHKTYADISKINKKFNYRPKFDISTGIKEFVNWYLNYFSKNK